MIYLGQNGIKIKWVVMLVMLVFLIIVLKGTFIAVPAGHAGVITTFGAVNDSARPEGMSIKVPFVQTLNKMQVRTQKIEWNDKNSPILCVSKDLQDIFILAVITYHPVPQKAPWIFKNIGLDYKDKKVYPLALNSIKTHTAKYNISEILQNREKITSDVNADLAKQLEQYHIVIENLSLINISFNPEYQKAIESKQIAEKQVETQRFTLEKQALEAQQQVKKAEADKQAKILEGQAIQEFNELVSKSISKDLLEYKNLQNQEKSIEKWNGQYPSVYAGNGSMPLIQIPTGQEKK